MSTIYIENGWWYYQWYERGRKRKKALRVKDKVSAKRLQTIWDAKTQQERTGLAPIAVNFRKACEEFLDRKSTTLKQNSLVRYREQTETLIRLIPVTSLHQMTSDHLTTFLRSRHEEGRAPKTIHEELALLKAILMNQYRDGQISQIPIRSWPVIKTVTKDPSKTTFYTTAEVEALKKFFADLPFNRPFLFACYTGARRSELREMRWRDVNLPEKFVTVRSTKTESDHDNQTRPIPIHPDLEIIFSTPGRPMEFLFPELHQHSRNWPHTQMQKACKKLDIPYRRFHGLRHTVATYLLSAGLPLREVMSILGWTQLDTAQRYIHLAKVAKGAMEKLPY